MGLFYVATEDEIKTGKTTDVYFDRTKKILKSKGLENVKVVAEVTTNKIPDNRPWGVLCGVEEAARLFKDVSVNVYSMPEGSVFSPVDVNGIRKPIMYIEGEYYKFCEFETPLLGFICQESGVATRAAFIKIAAGKKSVVAFGARRIHPALTPALDRAAYIGGLDGVSTLKGAEIISSEPMGTMPHALIIVFEDQIKAWKAYDEVLPLTVPRVALVDTYFDEKIEAIKAAELLKDRLNAVRLDTPGSRRGDFASIVREVRWELNLRGHNKVEIFVSGGLNENTVKELNEAGADGFGVGTYVSSAPTIDFALDIVSIEDRPVAKRGKLGGKKQVWRCQQCIIDIVQTTLTPSPRCPECGSYTQEMLKPLVKNGKIVGDLPSPQKLRERVLDQISRINK